MSVALRNTLTYSSTSPLPTAVHLITDRTNVPNSTELSNKRPQAGFLRFKEFYRTCKGSSRASNQVSPESWLFGHACLLGRVAHNLARLRRRKHRERNRAISQGPHGERWRSVHRTSGYGGDFQRECIERSSGAGIELLMELWRWHQRNRPQPDPHLCGSGFVQCVPHGHGHCRTSIAGRCDDGVDDTGSGLQPEC